MKSFNYISPMRFCYPPFFRGRNRHRMVQFSCSVILDSLTPWTAACQASLSITNSRSLLELMSIEWMMLSNHLILCHPFLLPLSIFPNIRLFSNESLLHTESGGQRIGVSASASVLPMNIIQD